jgi:hypothetical protein
MPGISKIDRPVNLLSRRESRDDSLGKKMGFEIVKIAGITEQEICKREAGPGNPWQTGEACLARSTEIKSAAGDVRLGVIVPANFELENELVLVTPLQHGEAGR